MTTTTDAPPPRADDPGQVDLAALWEQTQADVTEALAQVEWAEDEITAAIKRHPDAADLLYHSFMILRPGDGFAFPARTEFVWRGHYREQLERVAAGQDTRPATNAEICLLMSAASLKAPLRSGAVGLYIEAWTAAFSEFPDIATAGIGSIEDELEHYRRMDGYEMDQLRREALRAVANRNGWRRIPKPKDLICSGQHWGEPAPGCRFIPATLDGQPPITGVGAKQPRSKKTPPPVVPGPAAFTQDALFND